MTLALLHTRDVGSNVQFRLSFNVSLGLPSNITCTRDGATIHNGRGFVSGVNYEVIRPLYVSTSQPEITRVSFEQTRSRMGATYSCTVYVEGRVNISSGVYDYDQLGSATSTVTVTGEFVTTIYSTDVLFTIRRSSSPQLQAPPLVSLPPGVDFTTLFWSPGLLHHQHQLAMRCSIRQLVMLTDSV